MTTSLCGFEQVGTPLMLMVVEGLFKGSHGSRCYCFVLNRTSGDVLF